MPQTSSTTKHEPLYRRVCTILRTRIERGEYPIGGSMPNEIDLAAELKVSRATLRDALEILSELGLIKRTKKQGTTVLSDHAVQGYVQKMDKLGGILSFAGDTTMRIDAVDVVDGAEEAGLADTRSATGRWLRVRGARRMKKEQKYSTWTTVWVDGKYAGIQPLLTGEVDAIYQLVEQLYEVRVASLRQQVSAIRVPSYAAGVIDLRGDAPALQVTAWLFDERDRLVEYTRSIHNPELFNIEFFSKRAD